jgi:general secretion pathway protein L
MSVAESAVSPPPPAAAWLTQLWQPWRELHRMPPLSWLTPSPAVHLLQADGGESLWVAGRRRQASPRACGTARFVAVELPADEVLECTLTLPPMADGDRQEAVALEARLLSPFEGTEGVWGWREAADGQVTVLLAARAAVQARLDAAAARVGRRAPPEVWAFDRQGWPVVLQGFGEAARQRHAARGRRLGGLLLLLAALLLVAAALTPTVQLQLRAQQASRAYDEVQRQLAPVQAQREALVKAQGQLAALREQMAERVEPLAVLDLMTQAVPDDSFVQRLQLQGSKLTLTGQTPNTAALMNRLSSQPLVRDVRSPAASTRGMTAGRENFTIEMTLLPDALRPPGVAAPALAAPPAASAAAASAAPASAARASEAGR